MISIPLEGMLRINNPDTGQTTDAWSPTGDATYSYDLYDPKSQRLYVWGYSDSGWIEVFQDEGTWVFGDSGRIRPKLYNPIDDIEDVVTTLKSEALNLLFYYGYTAPHWITGTQRYRFFEIDGTKMRRVSEAENRTLIYLSDDPTRGMAVLAGPRRTSAQALYLGRPRVWYDGVNIIEPETGSPGPLVPYADDPFGRGDVLRDSAARLYLWNGATVTPLFDDTADPGLTSRPFYRASMDRWIVEGKEDWFLYSKDLPLQPLNMPSGVVPSHAKFLSPMPGLDRWITNRRGLWWENSTGAQLIAPMPEGWWIVGPANVGAIENGRSLAFQVELLGENREGLWFALTPKQTKMACTSPRELVTQILQ